MKSFKGSKIAIYIDNDYKKEKQWKEKVKRVEQSKNKTLIENKENK